MNSPRNKHAGPIKWFAGVALGLMIAPHSVRAQSCPATFSVGYRVSTFGSTKVGIWYPSSGAESAYNYFDNLSGSVVMNGTALTCQRFPLVVFSHAYGGCGTQSVFFTQELARRGYIVAAPDHQDALCSVDGSTGQALAPTQESFFDPGSWTDSTYADRKNDIELTINRMIADPTWGAVVDAGNIALAGHSLGGYTAFGIAGGWASWKDARIRATLLFSPYILPFQSQNTIAQVNIPVMYQGAQFDIGITPFLMGSNGAFAASNPPKFFAELVGGTHFDWTVLLCGSQTTVAGCLQSVTNAQAINNYGFAFLDGVLKSKATPMLYSTGPGLAAYQRTSLLHVVSAASLAPGVAPSSLATGFGDALAAVAASSNGGSLPASLGGVSVTVLDSMAVSRPASLSYVGPAQVNLLIPAGTAPGIVTINVVASSQTIASGTASVTNVAPALFSADGSGTGAAAAQSVTVGADGSQQSNLTFDPATLSPVPISMSATAPVYLVLYGTGLRGHVSEPHVSIGGTYVNVIGVAPQSQYAGLDQINVGPLPLSLAGTGTQTISVSVDGSASNHILVLLR